jgi:hypothetical protein
MLLSVLLTVSLYLAPPGIFDQSESDSSKLEVRALNSCVRLPIESAGSRCSVLELQTWSDELKREIDSLNSQGQELVKKVPVKYCVLDKWRRLENEREIRLWSSRNERPTVDWNWCRTFVESVISGEWNNLGRNAPSNVTQEFVDLYLAWYAAPTLEETKQVKDDAVSRGVAYLQELDSVIWPLIFKARELHVLREAIPEQIRTSQSISQKPTPKSATDCPLYKDNELNSFVSSGTLYTFSGGKQSLCRNGKWINKGIVKLEARYLTCSLFNSKSDYGCWVKDSRGFLTWLFDLPQGTPKGKVVSRGSYYTNNGFCQVSLYSNFAYRIKCN